MSHGICLLSHIPCRKEPSDKSEMVSQLLFGERYEVLEELEKWTKIKHATDGYESYICIKQTYRIDQAEYLRLGNEPNPICTELVQVVAENGNLFPIVMGSILPGIEEDVMEIDGRFFSYSGGLNQVGTPANKAQIIEDAFMYLGAPYLWGGRSPFGIDCSGFTQVVYGMNGVQLPRDASQQVELGNNYSFVEEAEAGDLAFFDNEEGHIVHVGIMLPEGRIIHASGKVRIDKLDHYGIFNEETGKYTHQLRIIKKII